MPTFHYTAKRGPRDVVEGVMDAENRGGVLTYLTDLGYLPVRVSEQTATAPLAEADHREAPTTRIRRVPTSHLCLFTRQFASLVRSYVPLLRSLQILEDQAKHPALRHVLRAVAEEVRQGQTLSSGLAKFPTVFPPLYVNLVRSGEGSGTLDVVLERLAQQAEQEEALRLKVRAAFTYPAFVGVVSAGTVTFLMTFVMPKLSRLLTGLGDRLPWPTRALLALTDRMSSGWFWAILLVGLTALAVLWRSAAVRRRLAVDRLMLRLPLFGQLIHQTEMARFARSLGLQLSHGIAVMQALDNAIQVVGHGVIRAELQRLPDALRQGAPLSSSLKGLSVGTPLLVHTLAVGEESGKVGDALTEVAAYYERDTERLLQVMATLLEPALILAVGLIVGFIVMAVLLPIFDMSAMSLS